MLKCIAFSHPLFESLLTQHKCVSILQLSTAQSQQQLVKDKKKEIEDLTVANGSLEHQLAELNERMREKEEDHKMQVGRCMLGIKSDAFDTACFHHN